MKKKQGEDEKKQGEDEKKEEGNEQHASFWKDWIRFLENNQNFHPYSPENHNVIRCGKNVSPRPNLDENIYKDHLKNHEKKEYELPKVCIPYLDKVFSSKSNSEYRKAIRNIPPCESDNEFNYNFLESIFRAIYNFHTTTVDVKDGEATFNSLFIYPFLETVTTWLKESQDWCKAGFRPGETQLISMGKQLKNIPLYKEDNYSYLVDGIIKLYGLKNIEIVLLETSGCFGSIDKSKIAFDHHKGLFGALAMLKSIADEFPMATVETFQKCKVFFVHGAGENIYLWSLRFEPKGPIYELWLEDTLYIKPDIDDKLDALPRFLNFFWGMKCLLTESILGFAQLKKEHTEYLVNNRFNGVTPSHTLSTIVNPSILKLLEEDDKAGMHLLGPFYCDPSSP
ncbi:hypothetical protein G6F56_004605 [Rhizopus delemar]|uniref:Uncharacterized protein n=1 Tax=Rhizopus stolonifer TaxID=4846 RepID=A0A367J865_RHIST|nr:hypothetical protein G6F56_004605 [Rhizopus delemar]RCH86106.1 hypothetical protein CU098_006498 [Rhizopus stolonifer]